MKEYTRKRKKKSNKWAQIILLLVCMGFFESLLNLVRPQAYSAGVAKPMDPALYKRITGRDLVTPTPTPDPTPTPFKYQMGESDYSRFQPKIEQYYKQQNSPALPYVPDIIKSANAHGVDPRVLVSLMFSESSNMKNYPPQTFNPVGYLVNGGGVQGLQNAGFASIPDMVDKVTSRFGAERNKYPRFTQNPDISTLQESYNANPAERQGYLDKLMFLMNQNNNFNQ